jgi:predicted phosphoribosyltransferase
MKIIDQVRIFKDRRDAGIELGKILESKYKDREVLVLGIPRGGVIVAHEVSKILNGELSVVITKKLPHPLQEELAIGAAAEDGSFYLTSLGKNMDTKVLQSILTAQEKEIQSRISRFRKGKPLPEMKNRIVILADDGIATGSTIVPAIQLCKKRGAAMVVVASPVSGEQYVSEIDNLADAVIIAEQPDMFYAVGQVYEDFHHLSDEEVIGLLENLERRHGKHNR